MTISSVGKSDAIRQYENVAGGSTPKDPPAARISDSVELSEGAQKYAALLKKAKEATETADANETARAAEIAARIQAGTYQASTDDVVGSILSGSPSKP